MFTIRIRKAKIQHECYMCNSKIKPKSHYLNYNKPNVDGTYTTGAICGKCIEEIFKNAINDD